MATSKDRREVIKSYFPRRLLENDEVLNTIILPVVDQMGIVGDFTELFVDLNSISYTPKEFVDVLGELVGWNYLSEEDPDVQREIIKRVFTIYNERGSEWSILNTLSRASDENWVGGNLHLYKGPVRKGSSSLSYPRDFIFTWDKSKWDRGHRYRDRLVYNYGIIDLEAELWSYRLKEFLEYVIPGGIRYRFTQAINPGSGDAPVDFSTDNLWWRFDEHLELPEPAVYMDSGNIEHWDHLKHKIWEGRYLIYQFYEEDYSLGATYLDFYRPMQRILSGGLVPYDIPPTLYNFGEAGADISPFKVIDDPWANKESIIRNIDKQILGFHYSFERNGIFLFDNIINCPDSGHPYDGLFKGGYTGYAKYDRIEPSDCTYPVGLVQDYYPDLFDVFQDPLSVPDRMYVPPTFFTYVEVTQYERGEEVG